MKYRSAWTTLAMVLSVIFIFTGSKQGAEPERAERENSSENRVVTSSVEPVSTENALKSVVKHAPPVVSESENAGTHHISWFNAWTRDLSEQISKTVDCDHQGSLSEMVALANENRAITRIHVIGECTEKNPVVINRNNLVIMGEGQTIRGNGVDPVIEVRGAKNIIISGLTLTGGKHGIFIDKNATVALSHIHATKNTGSGIMIGGDLDATTQWPSFGKGGPESAPVSEQSMGEALSHFVTQMLNKWDFSFIKSAVADDPVCRENGSFNSPDSDFPGDTTFFCGAVTVEGNFIGVSVSGASTLEIHGHLTMQNNTLGMGVESSAINVYSDAIVSEGEGSMINTFDGVWLQNDPAIHIYIDSTFITDSRIQCASGDVQNSGMSPRVITCD
ncbi:MAG: hypothetical protein COB33_009305 [Thiotrichaceae bacterium]|nr:hypothetical protein [Thiotrichaceae bacterium]PCI12428.1 MAG: hypothetical protein COB71_08950 [Thiotrichales bacterium]